MCKLIYYFALLLLSVTNSGARAVQDCMQCIFINETGVDEPLCLQNSLSTFPCRTLSYVLKNTFDLKSRLIIIHGNQQVNESFKVSNVENLKIQGEGAKSAIINCVLPSGVEDEGSGLMFENVTKLDINNVKIVGCGALYVSTTIRNGNSLRYRSAVLNSSDIEIT